MTTTTQQAQATMKALTFGIEIETVGATRETVAAAIQSVVGGQISRRYDAYDTVQVTALDGRTWKCVRDASLSMQNHAEVVSPILRYADIETLQTVVRAIRACGAKVDYSCGIHIHVGADAFSTKGLVNLLKQGRKQDALISKALCISAAREVRYCKGVEQTVLDRIAAKKPTTLDELNECWYGYRNVSPTHYDSSRYHGINLHNVWFRGTVEYRWFDGTLHAGKIKAYVQFCLAFSARAINAKSASAERRPFVAETAKYDFRCFLLALGLIGDEFKTCRKHLLDRLEGNASWKHGRPERAAA